MRIINLVDRLDKVNFGIWNAACFTASMLKSLYGVQTEVWFPETSFTHEALADCVLVPLKNTSDSSLNKTLQSRKLDARNCIIVSHGCWQYPTRWAAKLKQQGFVWVYVPHGMLEPWSLQQKKWIKKIYFYTREYPSAKRADCIRAVGEPEQANLKQFFANTKLIPNGIPAKKITIAPQLAQKKVLFMARLHHKKGVLPLVRAWKASQLHSRADYQLLIAGPDDGELPALQLALQHQAHNIKYLGSVFGPEKEALLTACSFFILPSASEGFPTGVLEGMQYGLYPIITRGCNFPALFRLGLALETEQNETKLVQSLNQILSISDTDRFAVQKRAQQYVNKHYSAEEIAKQQHQHYSSLLQHKP